MQSNLVAPNAKAHYLTSLSYLQLPRLSVVKNVDQIWSIAHRYKPVAMKTEITDTANRSSFASLGGGCASSAEIKLSLYTIYVYRCTNMSHVFAALSKNICLTVYGGLRF